MVAMKTKMADGCEISEEEEEEAFNSIFQLLNNIASDLDLMLNDLYRTYGASVFDPPRKTIRQPKKYHLPNGLRNGSVLHTYKYAENERQRNGLHSLDRKSPTYTISSGFSTPQNGFCTPASTPLFQTPTRGQSPLSTPPFSSPSSTIDHSSLRSSDIDFFSADDPDQNSSTATGTSYFANSESEMSPRTPTSLPPSTPVLVGSDSLDLPEVHITALERLMHTHPIWFLPNIGRAGAAHLLQNKKEGSFIVRQSSRKDYLVLSVRLGPGQRTDHYIVVPTRNGTSLQLEGSAHQFSAIPFLIEYYCNNKDELPVRLTLPAAIQKARTQHELTSLALLGQDFWNVSFNHAQQGRLFSAQVDDGSPYHCGLGQARTPVTMASNPTTTNGVATGAAGQRTSITMTSLVRDNSKSQDNVLENSQNSVKQVSQVMHYINGYPSNNDPSKDVKRHSATFETEVRSQRSSQIFESGCSDIDSPAAIKKSNDLFIPGQKVENYDSPRIDIMQMNGDTTSSSKVGRFLDEDLLDQIISSDHKNRMYSHQSASCDGSQTSSNISQLDEIFDNVRTDDRSGYVKTSGFPVNNISQKNERDSCFLVDMSPGPVKQQRDHLNPISTSQQITSSKVQHNNNVNFQHVSQPEVFTFDFVNTPSLGAYDDPNNGFRKHSCPAVFNAPPPPVAITTKAQNSPAYAEPYDSLLGKRNGMMNSQGVVRVSNSLATKQQENAWNNVERENILNRKMQSLSHDCIDENSVYNSHTIPKKGHDDSLEVRRAKARARYSDACIQVNIAESPKYAFKPYTRNSSPSHVADLKAKLNEMKLKDAEEQAKNDANRPQVIDLTSYMVPSSHNNQVAKTESVTVTQSQAAETKVKSSEPVKRRKSFLDSVPAIFIDKGSDTDKSLEDLCEVATEGSLAEDDPILRDLPLSQSFQENFFQPEPVENHKEEPSTPVGKFPVFRSEKTEMNTTVETKTVEEMIHDISPDLTMKPIKPLTVSNVQRMSQYDNMSGLLGQVSRRTASSNGTCYCKPWDSSIWDDLLNLGGGGQKGRRIGCSHEDGITDADFSSAGQGSRCESPAASDARTNLLSCELATSFEWKHVEGEDDDSTTDRMSPQDGVLPQSISANESLLPVSQTQISTPTNMFSRIKRSTGSHLSHVYISDDEGTGDQEEEEFGTDSFRKRLKPLIASPKREMDNTGARAASFEVRDFICSLSRDESTTFGATVQNFIQCTIEGSETSPQIVMRNIRQFMNGIKNYLVQHGEDQLNAFIEMEREGLGEDEFLNIDAIIEGALHKCVIRPLKEHIYKLMVTRYKQNGHLQTLSDNIKHARNKTLQELGFKSDIMAPQPSVMDEVRHFLHKMQRAYSPLKKLENLLSATTTLYNSVDGLRSLSSSRPMVVLGVDDFLPVFLYVLIHSGMVSAEIEADYMWGLLHPCLLSGEGGYCLTTLSSAVNVLMNIHTVDDVNQLSIINKQGQFSSANDLHGLLKIIIPDEKTDSILTRTLPVTPSSTAREICSMIAHKFKITNPQDYGLYILIDGIEERMYETDCPRNIKSQINNEGHECKFAFKRNNAKFIWSTHLGR